MMHVWTFYLSPEGQAQSRITDEEEHQRVVSMVKEMKGCIFLPSGEGDIYINLPKLKCATHQQLTDEQVRAAEEEKLKAGQKSQNAA